MSASPQMSRSVQVNQYGGPEQLQVVSLSVVTDLGADVWWLSALNASLCTVLPVVLVMLSIERIGSALASQAGMVGPMSTLVMASLVLDEPLSPWLLLGTALVMSGVFICSRGQDRSSRTPPSPVE